MTDELAIDVSSPLCVQDPGITTHGIQPQPSFPALTATAKLPGTSPDDLASWTFTWQLQITYTDTVRNDVVTYPETDWEVTQGPQWQPQAPMIAGGDLRVICRATAPDGSAYTGASVEGAHRVLGGNPDKDVIRNSLPQDNLVYAAVLWQESRFTQFKDGQGISNTFVLGYNPPICGYDSGGTIGYGLGQLTTPAPQVHDLWDWTWNVSSSLDRLNGFRDNASTYANQVQLGLPWDSKTGGKPPNEGTAYPAAPEFTTNELNLEMLARFNGGYRYHDYDPASGQWVRRLPGGQDAGTSLPYADKVRDIADNAAVGNFPPGWN